MSWNHGFWIQRLIFTSLLNMYDWIKYIVIRLLYSQNIPCILLQFSIFGTKISPASQNKKTEIFTVHSYCLIQVHMQGHVPDWSYIERRWVHKHGFAKVTYFLRMSSEFVPVEWWLLLFQIQCKPSEYCAAMEGK